MRKRIHGTFFCGDFLNFLNFSVNAFFPIATSSSSPGSSEGGLERRRFFVLPGAFARAESLSSESRTEFFRLIRCNKSNRTRCELMRTTRTYFLRLLFFVGEHINVNGITTGRRASRAVTLPIGGPSECRTDNRGITGFAKIWGLVQRRGRRGSIRGCILETPLHRWGRRRLRLRALGEEGHETLLLKILFGLGRF